MIIPEIELIHFFIAEEECFFSFIWVKIDKKTQISVS